MKPILVDGTCTVEQWLRAAPGFGLDAVEMYYRFLGDASPSAVASVKKLLADLGLQVSMVTCSPDLAHPDPALRNRQIADVKRYIEIARELGTDAVRTTTGQRHPGVTDEQGIPWVVDAFLDLAEFGKPLGVQVALENHYRDRSVWEEPDFAVHAETFYKVFDCLESSPVVVNFDCSNPVMVGDSPSEILRRVKHKVRSVHASDRKAGEYQHSIIGRGDVPYDEIFPILAGMGFSGWISAEDGNPYGDEGFRKSLEFLRGKIAEYWG